MVYIRLERSRCGSKRELSQTLHDHIEMIHLAGMFLAREIDVQKYVAALRLVAKR